MKTIRELRESADAHMERSIQAERLSARCARHPWWEAALLVARDRECLLARVDIMLATIVEYGWPLSRTCR